MIRRVFHRLRLNRRGTMAIETAIVTPVLALMALGTFEVGSLVSRQQELQSSASEAEGIILAAAGSSTPTPSTTIKEVIEDSLGLSDDQVSLEQRFRCNAATTLMTDDSTCDTEEPTYQYVLLTVTDTYTPVWTNFGVGSPISYRVQRTIQVQ